MLTEYIAATVSPSPVQAAPLPAHGSPGRVEAIDALRGLACVWVLFHHSRGYWLWHIGRPVLWRAEQVANFGYLGVNLFLCISGFVLFHPIVRRHGVRQATTAVPAYLARRCRRILPPYYVALVIFAAVTLLPGGRVLGSVADVKSDVLHLVMLFNLSPDSIAQINGSFWSLALEFQLYLVFPLLLWGCRRVGLPAVVGGTLALALVWQGVVAPRQLPATGSQEGWTQGLWAYQAVWYSAVPGRLFEFTMGMVAAAAVARPRRWHLAAAAAALVVLPPIGFAVASVRGSFRPGLDQLWGVSAASLIVLSAAIPARVTRWPAMRLIAWLGGISYSVYLLHQPLLELSYKLLIRPWGVPIPYRLALFLAAGLPALVALGWAFHCLVERPFMSPRRRPPLTPADGPTGGPATAEPPPAALPSPVWP